MKRLAMFLLFALLSSMLSACSAKTTLRYTVTGTAEQVGIEYLDETGKQISEIVTVLPFDVSFDVGKTFTFQIYAINLSGQGTVKCEVFVDEGSLGKANGEQFAGCEGKFVRSSGNLETHFIAYDNVVPEGVELPATPAPTATPIPERVDLGDTVVSVVGTGKEGAALYLYDPSTDEFVQWTEPVQFIGCADWSPSEPPLVFNAGVTGNVRTYIASLDAASLVNVTDITESQTGSDGCSHWSPDGKQIALDAKGTNGKGHHIFVMNANGTRRVQLTTGEQVINSRPAWSPDGTKLVFQSLQDYVKSALFVVNVDGTGLTKLIEEPGQGDEAYISAVWSPDGMEIAYIRDVKGPEAFLNIMNADGSNIHQVFDEPLLSLYSVAWSPDGTRLIFNATETQNGLRGVYIVNADGSGFGFVGGLPEIDFTDPRFIPTGYIAETPTQPTTLLP